MLVLRKSDFDEIRRHGEDIYPLECCGVLLGLLKGDARAVRAAIRCVNARTDFPQTRYSIDPHELVAIQRDARQRGLDIIGFYHSHPDHPPRWSETDFEEAYWIGCSYVITQVEAGQATLTTSYVLTGGSIEDKAFVEEEIMLE